MPQQSVVFSSRIADAGSRQLNEEGRIIRNTLIALAPSLKSIGCNALAALDQEIKKERPRKDHHEIHRTLFQVGHARENEFFCVGVTLDDYMKNRAVWVSYGKPHVGDIGRVDNVIFSLDFYHPGTSYLDPAAAAKGWICRLLDAFGTEVLSRDSTSVALYGVMEEAARRSDLTWSEV
jgi:hypothetical protein